MFERSEYHYFLKDIFPRTGPELMRLLQGAADNAVLLRSDFYSVSDWLEIAGYQDRDEAHAILLLMQAALEEGSLCLEIAEGSLVRRLRDFVPEADAGLWTHRILAALAPPGLPALIGRDPANDKPVIAHTSGTRQFLYFQKYLRAELGFRSELSRRLEQNWRAEDAPWPAIVREVLATQPLVLDRDQKLAIAAALFNNLTIISGGPGTGKTSVILTLLRCLSRAGTGAERIALAAPTGRAAQRLTDVLRAGLDRLPNVLPADAALRDLSATTLHQLLAYRPTRNVFARHRENPIPADVIIVDEVSMVGLLLMSQLLQALAPAAKLVLLGDKDQLPSVDAGAVLASIIPDQFSNGFHGTAAAWLNGVFPELDFRERPAGALQNRVVLLQTNHRSQEQIRAAAQAINRQDAGVVDQLPTLSLTEDISLSSQCGCRLLEQTLGTASELRHFLQRWIDEAYFQSRIEGKTLAEHIDEIELSATGQAENADRFRQLFLLVDRFRLLTLVRDGAWGCNEINEFFELFLRPRLHRDTRSGLFVGAQVLITRNDAARGLFNGDVGITLRDRQGGLRVLFERRDGCISFPSESLPAHELGFALTVHKSQGSEYQNVMVVLPPAGGRRLLAKELIYTAITRAKSLAVICSTKEAIQFAIARKIVRESALDVK